MADYTIYPTAGDVEILLRSVTAWPVGDDTSPAVLYAREQAQTTIDGAISEFEESTGWKPFLAGAEDETDHFPATDGNGYLDLKGGAVSIASISVAGTVYTRDTQWWPMPSNARRQREPYTGIQFSSALYASRSERISPRIAVTARWGYCDVMPAAAWLAIMRLAAAQTLGQIENAQGVASISQGGFSKAFDVVGVITQKDLLGELTKRFDKIVGKYERVVC